MKRSASDEISENNADKILIRLFNGGGGTKKSPSH